MRTEASRGTVVPFRFAINSNRATAGTSYVETDLTCANLGGRVADMCWDFEYFKVTELDAYVVATLDTSPSYLMQGVAFDETPAAFVTTPTSVTRLVSFRHSSFGNQYSRPRISVRGKEFAFGRPQRWFHTQPTGSPDASESSAGTLYQHLELGCTGTLTVAANQYCIVHGVVVFNEPVDPTLSRERRRKAEEKFIGAPLVIPASLRDDPYVVNMVAKMQHYVEEQQELTPGAVVVPGHTVAVGTPLPSGK